MTKSKCEACDRLYETLSQLKGFGAGVDIGSYTGDNPLRCKNGHQITEAGIKEIENGQREG